MSAPQPSGLRKSASGVERAEEVAPRTVPQHRHDAEVRVLAASRHAVDGLGQEGHLEAVAPEGLLDHDPGQELVVRGLQRLRVAPVHLELLHDAVEAALAAHRGLDAPDLLVPHLGREAVAFQQGERFFQGRAHGALGALPVRLLQDLGDRQALGRDVHARGADPELELGGGGELVALDLRGIEARRLRRRGVLRKQRGRGARPPTPWCA